MNSITILCPASWGPPIDVFENISMDYGHNYQCCFSESPNMLYPMCVIIIINPATETVIGMHGSCHNFGINRINY